MPDIVVECTGVPGMIARAIQLVKPRGTIVVSGWCSERDSFLPMIAVQKELRILFSILYSFDDYRFVINDMATKRNGVHRAMVTDTVSFSAFPEAFEALRGRGSHCKVMLAPCD